MKLYYIWDTYCGWTYGFAKHFENFMKNHPELEIEIISGGLFTRENTQKMVNMVSKKEINKKIEAYYGVVFGEEYNKLFSDKNFEIDSLYPARAYSILEKYISNEKKVELTNDIHKLFFQNGLDLSKSKNYISIIEKYKLNEKIIEELTKELEKEKDIHPDFIKSYKMGIQSYPTLIVEKNGNYYNLIQNVKNEKDLEKNYLTIKNI